MERQSNGMDIPEAGLSWSEDPQHMPNQTLSARPEPAQSVYACIDDLVGSSSTMLTSRTNQLPSENEIKYNMGATSMTPTFTVNDSLEYKSIWCSGTAISEPRVHQTFPLTSSQNGYVEIIRASNSDEGSAEKSGSSEHVRGNSIDTAQKRSSIYRGVTRHKWTRRYEAHLWDSSYRKEGRVRKGKQVYLGGYDTEEKAAMSYDLAALKYWGSTATTNFPSSNYTKEIEEMKDLTREEYVASLRRKSCVFSRGASIYRGVTRLRKQDRWQARIGRVADNKDLYLGVFNTEEAAAEAYDIAAIRYRGQRAVTNFNMNRYDVQKIISDSKLCAKDAAKYLKEKQTFRPSVPRYSIEVGKNPDLEMEKTNHRDFIHPSSFRFPSSTTISDSLRPFTRNGEGIALSGDNVLYGNPFVSCSTNLLTPEALRVSLDDCANATYINCIRQFTPIDARTDEVRNDILKRMKDEQFRIQRPEENGV